METKINTVDSLLSALGIGLPADLLARLDIEEYLNHLDDVVALKTGERQRLEKLLRTIQEINFKQSEAALTELQPDSLEMVNILIKKGIVAHDERELLSEIQRHQASLNKGAGKFPLGKILVAAGEITPVQLEGALLRQSKSGRRLGEELIIAGHASKVQIESGLLLQRKLLGYALAFTVGLAPLAPSAEASQKRAAIPVSVTVIARANMQISSQIIHLNISELDIARGYVEIPAATRFSVTTNSRSGYLMEFYPVGNLFESVHVGGLGNPVRLGADGGAIVQRGVLSPNVMRELSFRFILRPDVRSGNYPWPLLLSVRPL